MSTVNKVLVLSRCQRGKCTDLIQRDLVIWFCPRKSFAEDDLQNGGQELIDFYLLVSHDGEESYQKGRGRY